MTIKDFVEKKVAIAFTNVEQIKEFAKMCEGHGLVMSVDESDAVEWMKNKPEMLFDGIEVPFLPGLIVGKNKFVFFTYDFKEADMPGGLSWNGNDELSDPHITEKGWKIVPFEEFKNPAKRKFRCVAYKKTEQHFTIGKVYEMHEDGSITCDEHGTGHGYTYPKHDAENAVEWLKPWYEFEEVFEDEEEKKLDFTHKIEIYYDGEKVTTARMIVNGKIVKEATSRRNPEDKFDFAKGATLAFNRLFKREERAIPRKAEPGETIEIAAANDACGLYKNGDRFKVYKVDNVGVGIKMNHDNKYMTFDEEPNTVFVGHEEYVVIE